MDKKLERVLEKMNETLFNMDNRLKALENARQEAPKTNYDFDNVEDLDDAEKLLRKNAKEAIDEILENFDFTRVHEVMKFLDWTWYTGGVPSEEELYDTVKEYCEALVDSAVDKLWEHDFDDFMDADEEESWYTWGTSTGGFDWDITVMNNMDVVIDVKFVLTHWRESNNVDYI